ncbi:MAG: rhodanese-like domain-containing protein [Vicinamibacterales bacterium]
MPKQVTVTEALDLQKQGHAYVDVRSTGEFAAGHPEGAINIPLLEPDPRTGQMQPNPEFLRHMQTTFAADAPLLIGCQVGGRSQRAAVMLKGLGYTDVANVRGGFGGLRDAMGRVVDPGWADSGLPVETGQPAGRSYADVVAKADGSS